MSERPRSAQRSGTGRKLAYLQEGAFTQYLIDRFGLDAYLRVFNGEGFEAVIGASIEVIEADWRNLMKTFAVVARLSEGG